LEILDRLKNNIFEDALSFDLRTQAEYLSLTRDVDYPFSALTSKAKLLPHQVGVAHKVLSSIRSGSLLADEVGLGKTIEAGMILKEYLCRKQIKKILILTPASLTTQWRDELKSKFDEGFVIYDQETRKNLERRHENIWKAYDKVICSIDTAKQQRYRKDIVTVNWDIIIVDEAHKLKNRKTENYKLLEDLPKNRVFFLTATPLQNKLEELYNLISLIDEKLLGTYDSFSMRFVDDTKGLVPNNFDDLKQRLQKVMIRNRRKDVFGVRFTQRFGETIPFELTPEERRLYDEVTKYVKQEYLKAMEQNKAGRGFLLIIMQRMVCSSSFAIRDSLGRRIQRLVKISKEYDIVPKQPSLTSISHPYFEALGVNHTATKDEIKAAYRTLAKEYHPDISPLPKDVAEEKFKEISEAYETLTDDNKRKRLIEEHEDADISDIAKNFTLLQMELEKLNQLYELASKITKNSKGEKLIEALEALKREEPNEKVLIYTEFRSTQRYLYELLTSKGYEVAIFNGSMSVEEKDEAVKQWRENKQIMVSTECGGEGRNFQFCHIMFNYDLPWNPMRVEQRIGRIHRIGQEKNVKIFNFSTKETIEEYVLELLETKIQLFKEVIGELDLILGDIVEDANLERVIMEILVKAKTSQELKENFEELGRKIQIAREEFKKGLKDLDERVYAGFDLSVYRRVMGTELENLVMKERIVIKRFFLNYLKSKNLDFRYLEPEEAVIFQIPEEFKNIISDFAQKQRQFYLRERDRFYELLEKPLEIAKDIHGFIEDCVCKLCSGHTIKSCFNCSIHTYLENVAFHANAGFTSILKNDLDYVTSNRFREDVEGRILRGKIKARATFSPEVAQQENIELITIGNRLVENAIEECKKKGLTTKKLIDLSKHTLRGFEKYSGLRGILFNFKVSFESFDKKEELIPIVIDLDHMKYEEELSGEVNWLYSTELLDQIAIKSDEVDEAYQLAVNELNTKVKTELEKIRGKNKMYFEDELNKIETYYDDIRHTMILKERELEDKYVDLIGRIRNSREFEAREKYREEQRKIEIQLTKLRNENNRFWEEMVNKRAKELKKLEEQNTIKTKIELINSALIKIS
jgi:SNF2 family DNA or RNA helicase